MKRQKAIEFFKNVPPKVHTLLIRETKADLTPSSETGQVYFSGNTQWKILVRPYLVVLMVIEKRSAV